MTSRWNTARLALRRAGPEGLLNVVLRRGLRPLGAWQALAFFEREIADDIPEAQPGIPLEARVAAGDDVRSCRPVMESAGVQWERIEARLAQGDVCGLGFSEGRLVHASWVTTRAASIPELRAMLVPRPDEAYVYDSFTLPDVRGRAVQPAVSAEILRWARARGLRRLLFYVRGSSPSALRIVRKMGARRTVVIRCFRPAEGASAWLGPFDRVRGPRLEFGPAASVRTLGPLGSWVRTPGR
jgi:ribosomal protein S18 acetylase RimI-like enzyme